MPYTLIAMWGCAEGLPVQSAPTGGTDSAFQDVVDDVGPLIVFEPLTENQPSGEDVLIVANISDEGTGVFLATLYFRNETDSSKDWNSIGFLGPADGDEWVATIAGDEQHSSGMWYYMIALDGSQNEVSLPDDGGEAPFHFGYSD